MIFRHRGSRPARLLICLVLFASACGSPDENPNAVADQAASDSTTSSAPGTTPPGDVPTDPALAGEAPTPDAPTGGEGSAATSHPPASAAAPTGPMPLNAPRSGSYVYVRESGSDTEERTEEYNQEQKGDDHVVMFRQFRVADVTLLSVEAWADSRARSPGVYWIQTRVPGITTDWCKWPADNRPKLLPGDLSKPQTLNVDSTCTVRTGETMTVKGVVEVKGRNGSTDTARVDTKVTVSYRGPAQSATRAVEGTALISPAEGLVIEASGSYSGTGIRRTEFRDRLQR